MALERHSHIRLGRLAAAGTARTPSTNVGKYHNNMQVIKKLHFVYSIILSTPLSWLS